MIINMGGQYKFLFCIVAGLFLSVACFSQNKTLTIGDTIPDIEIKRIINYSAPTANLADFKGKLILLDFWATWCSNCIEAFPKLDSLQNVFKDKIVILPVTSQDEKRAIDFWNNNPMAKGSLLPSVVEDSVLRHIFPHDGLPHEVWIDGEGVVRAITNGEYVTAENIQAILDGKKVDWLVHVPRNRTFKVDRPLVRSSNNGSYAYDIRNYTVLTKHIKGVPRSYGITVDSIGKTKRFYATNNSIVGLCNIIMRYNLGFYTKNRIVLETTDSSRYYYNGQDYRDQWDADNQYCYEAVLPISLSDSMMARTVLQDLNKFLNMEAHIGRIKTHCLVLSKDAKLFLHKKRLNMKKETLGRRSIPISEFVGILNNQTMNPPVINETGLSNETRLNIQIDSWTDIPGIQNKLKAHGLILVSEERELDILTIYD